MTRRDGAAIHAAALWPGPPIHLHSSLAPCHVNNASEKLLSGVRGRAGWWQSGDLATVQEVCEEEEVGEIRAQDEF